MGHLCMSHGKRGSLEKWVMGKVHGSFEKWAMAGE